MQRELARLVDSGLVTVTRVGNQKHYQANRDAPVFHELRGIIVKTSGLAEPVRAALAPLRQIKFAAIFGSVAKGEDHAGSDVDLLVVADKLTLEDLFGRVAPVERRSAGGSSRRFTQRMSFAADAKARTRFWQRC